MLAPISTAAARLVAVTGAASKFDTDATSAQLQQTEKQKRNQQQDAFLVGSYLKCFGNY